MGYRCPVCETPQQDAGHLADHLAFTAMLRGEDHEAWLSERVPDWGSLGTQALSEHVVEYAEETEFETVFEDTTGGAHGSAHGHERGRPDVDLGGAGRGAGATGAGGAAFDSETQAVLHEARELTREMLDADGGTEGADTPNGSQGTADANAPDADEDVGDEQKES